MQLLFYQKTANGGQNKQTRLGAPKTSFPLIKNRWVLLRKTVASQTKTGAIWLIYSTDYLHFSSTLATALFTSVWLTSAFFEIPTGALADRIGRRKAFTIGNLLLMFYPLAYIFNLPLYVFVPALIIAGLGNALTSGSLMPLVHNDYERAGYGKKAYHKFLASSRAILFIARALSGVVGALLYLVHPWLPFVGWFVAILCNVIIGWLLYEDDQEIEHASYKLHISAAVKEMTRNRIIVVLLLSYTLINFVAEAIWTGYRVLYKQDGQSAVIYGALFSVIAVFSALSAYLVRKLYARLSPASILFIGSILVCITAWMLYQNNTGVRLYAVTPMAIASGFMSVTVSAVIQHQIKNSLQSTALSIYSVVVYIVYCLGSLWIGWVFDNSGTDRARLYLLVGSIIASASVILLRILSGRNTRFRLEDESEDIENHL